MNLSSSVVEKVLMECTIVIGDCCDRYEIPIEFREVRVDLIASSWNVLSSSKTSFGRERGVRREDVDGAEHRSCSIVEALSG